MTTTEWGPLAAVHERSPLLRATRNRYAETTPFAELTVGVSAPLTPHTGLFVDVLATGGADVLVTGEAGSTDPTVVEWLRDRSGVTPLASTGLSASELTDTRRELLEAGLDLIADDGAHLVSLLHDEFPDAAAAVRGACEQTTGGITRLQAMAERDRLAFPVYDVNGAPMKRQFDNVHGTAESSLTAIAELTDIMFAGSVAVVAGYGRCGRGIARKLRSLGARTIVTEVDPRKALEALADGHDVRPMAQAVGDADLVITATGRYRVLRAEHLNELADGTVIASIGSAIEIDDEALADAASVERRDSGVSRYTFTDGRTVSLLTDGRVVNLAAPDGTGNPSAVMDTTFALMSRGLAALAAGVDHPPGLYELPDRIDRAVATEKLTAMGVEIDEVSPEQRAYHEEWQTHDAG